VVNKKSQVSFEYLIILGFIMFIIIGILGVAFLYTGSINDQIKETQLSNCANKIISTAESVFYAGQPSKATITCYLPDNIKNISIEYDNLYVESYTSAGISIRGYQSNVPIAEGTPFIRPKQGIKRIEIVAEESRVVISRT